MVKLILEGEYKDGMEAEKDLTNVLGLSPEDYVEASSDNILRLL